MSDDIPLVNFVYLDRDSLENVKFAALLNHTFTFSRLEPGHPENLVHLRCKCGWTRLVDLVSCERHAADHAETMIETASKQLPGWILKNLEP